MAKAKAAPPLTSRVAPLDQLYVAPENARFDTPLVDIDELAANIAACGLLSPLLVYADDAGRFAVVGGARRLAALAKMFAANARFDFDKVPLRETTQDRALEISLAENTQRVDLSIVDAAIAWNRMVSAGRDVAEIARAFGVTERFVKSRIKLASLHEPILEALRSGEISLDTAQIYATAHMSRQERVWKALGKQKGIAWRVREELKRDTLLAGDALARFVGEDAYVAAGGQVEHELFQTPDMSRWLDPALAERLALEKLQAKAAELEGEGFLFVEAATEIPYGKYVDGNLGKPRKPTAEEKERLKAITDEIKALDKEHAAIEKACEARDTEDETAEYTDAESDRMTAIEDRQIELRNAKSDLEDQLYDYDDAAKKKSGVTLTIGGDGQLAISRGVVAPRERKATPAGKAKTKGKAASANPSKPEPQAAMTNLTHEKTSRIASTIVGRTLANNPKIALVALTSAAARDVLLLRGGGGALEVRGFDQGEDVDGLLSDDEAKTQRKKWEVALSKVADLESELAKWSIDELLQLLAWSVGHAVSVVETNAATDYRKNAGGVQLSTLGRLAGANPAAHFIPDLEYLSGYSRASLEAAAKELDLDSAGVKTKGALASLIADNAKGGGATAAWVPPLLRTLCGVDEPPKPKAAKPAAKKAAKKAVKTAKAKKIAKPPAKKIAAPKAAKGAS